MTTGKHPFATVPPMRLATAIIEQPPPMPSNVNPIVTGGIEAVIIKAMQKKPDARFATAESMLEALSDPEWTDESAPDDKGMRRRRSNAAVRRRLRRR
jgi:serine/threonine-protein kinase